MHLAGERPKIALGTPECYVELAKRCMHSNLKERPTARYINASVTAWFEDLVSESNESIIKKNFLEADNMKPNPESQKHSKHMYTSKRIDVREITKKFSKMAINDPVDSEISDNLK
ncbi:9804_t:CDS:2, partial [Cetraspora pellucida]